MCKVLKYLSCGTLLVGLMLICIVRADAEEGGVNLRFAVEQSTITVTGRITDAATGAALPSATVRGHLVVWRYQDGNQVNALFAKCPYQEVQADGSGHYKLAFTTPLTTSGPMKGKDSVCLSVCAPGYETKPHYVQPRVTPENVGFADVDIALYPGKPLRGRVVDSANRPIAEAMVRVQNGWNGDWNHFGSMGKTWTDGNGQFELWLNRGHTDYLGQNPWLLVSKQGQGSAVFWDILEQEDMGTLVLPELGRVKGKVVGMQGRGLADCEVTVWTYPVGLVDAVVTNAQGEYELKGVPGDPGKGAFLARKNPGREPERRWLASEVYARVDPAMKLSTGPQYTIIAKEGETITAPDLVAGLTTSVSGTLVPAHAAFEVNGLLVRLDGSWGNMVECDADGAFYFPHVPPGKHKLTAYLPTNLRGDRGIGRAEIDVDAGGNISDIAIDLDPLATVPVQFFDIHGQPVEGITAGATQSKSGTGFWTEGTRSDEHGHAVLYVHPGALQYVRGFDHSGRSLVSEGFVEITPKEGDLIDPVQIAMVPAATIKGRAITKGGVAIPARTLLVRLEYADGAQRQTKLETDEDGRFEVSDPLPPGVVRVSIQTDPLELAHEHDAIELKPGEQRDLHGVVLARVKFHTVSGRVVPSPTFSNLEGFTIRLDLGRWEPMVPTDANGAFFLDKVPAGRHRLTAYLPYNHRTDRGVGHVEIDVDDDMSDVELPLETLATIHLRIGDPSGETLEGISAAAWWTENHSGVFTEGTKSDAQGNATLYLYPDSLQYVGAHDWSKGYKLQGHHEVNLEPGEVVSDLRVTMTPASD